MAVHFPSVMLIVVYELCLFVLFVFPIRTLNACFVFVVSVVIVRSAEQGIRKGYVLVEPMIRVIVRIAVKLAFFSDI